MAVYLFMSFLYVVSYIYLPRYATVYVRRYLLRCVDGHVPTIVHPGTDR